MRAVIGTGAAVRSARATRRDLLLEILALRHQLGVLARSKRRFRPADRLFDEVSSLVISKGALQTTNSEVFVVPLIVGGETGEKATPLLTELVAGLLAAMRDNRVPDFCRSLGAETLQLATLKDGLFIATLRNVNKFFELKPGVAGLGVNLNAVIERIVGSPTRPLSQ